MRRLAALLLAANSLLLAANIKMYLKDGTSQVVKEYKVEGGRVKFYAMERSQWEEIPLELVDLERTESEAKERAAARAEQAKLISEEDKARKALDDEILKIPQDAGVYTLDGAQLVIFRKAESKAHTNKGRAVLKAIAPAPIFSGKATVELDGDHALLQLANKRPDLYIQIDNPEHFALAKLTPKHGVRIVEHVEMLPVAKEVGEQVDEVKIFSKQLTDGGLFKFWPQEPLEPGEYAVMQFTPGKLNAQIWDFAIKK